MIEALQERQKLPVGKKEHSLLERMVLAGGIVSFLFFAGSKGFEDVSRDYYNVLTRYADSDRNGIISQEEKELFDNDLFGKEGFIYSSIKGQRMPKLFYSDGESVPSEVISEVIEAYIQSKHSLK